MWLWTRALIYMLIVSAGWLCVLPALLLYSERGADWPVIRSMPLVLGGLVFISAGVALALWAGCYLITLGNGTPLPLDPPRHLVTDGPYRFVRNPQAIAMVLMVLGELLTVDSALIWLMLPLTVVYLELLVGPIETRQLAKKFGAEYDEYVAHVPKWIPRW